MKKQKLHNIKSPGFKVPIGYFNSFEDTLLSEIRLKDTLEGQGFRTPEGYFDDVEDSIMDTISSKNNTSKVVRLFSKRNLLYATSVAACFILLFSLPLLNTKITWDSLDTETVENYIMNENVGTYEIAALFNEEDLEEVDFVNHTFNEETLETYLLNHLNIENFIIE
ncbi:hypothetical protein [Snuella sedimenti]|uniref:Uncharacterized protein n=1 Tax=Snuella sedimenti TaxID=2798802 RepID=A0A8J7JAU0_9FLAO|nr:hypothetical protein [Snuella sedimenti]MBJ6367639.1 hypothetical protein [Snuella sedimenti]